MEVQVIESEEGSLQQQPDGYEQLQKCGICCSDI